MKTLVVSLEHRFHERNGQLFTKLAFSYDYWARYLAMFDEVVVVARAQPAAEDAVGEEAPVTGPRVRYEAMPYYQGPAAFVARLPALLGKAAQITADYDRFVLRSGNVSNLLWLFLMLRRKPYLREFPGNISEGILGFVGRASLPVRMIAAFSHGLAKLQARHAAACSYVSETVRALYPARSPAQEYVFSSVQLPGEVDPRADQAAASPFRLVSMGRLENEKGHEVLLRAAAALREPVEVHLVGDGTRRPELEALARELGVRACFHGAVLDRRRLFSIVTQANLFVLPSLTEGMPRALIEAMSLNVPCAASAVGGVGELMDDEFTTAPGDVQGLAALIARLMESEALRERNAQTHRDLVRTRYDAPVVEAKMNEFWRRLA